MYFDNDRNVSGLITVEDNFATLLSISSGENDNRSTNLKNEIILEFAYKISQVKAIQENLFSVDISIKKKKKIRPIIVNSPKLGTIDPDGLIDNILNHKSKIYNLIEKDKEDTISKITSDITSRINNQVVTNLKANNTDATINGLQKVRILLKEEEKSLELGDSEPLPMSPMFAHVNSQNFSIDSSNTFNSKNLRLSLLRSKSKSKSLSPASVTKLTNRSVSTYESLTGVLRKNIFNEYVGDKITDLFNSYIFDGQGSKKSEILTGNKKYVTVSKDTFEDEITIKQKIRIPIDYALQETSLIVKFDLIKSEKSPTGEIRNLPVESIEKNLYLQELIKEFYSPMIPPSVSAGSNTNSVVLQVKQNDDLATGVKIYKKSINDENFYTPYQLLTFQHQSVSDGVSRYQFSNLHDEISIYRVVPYNIFNNLLSCEFSDIVVRGKQTGRRKLVIVPELTSAGVKVTAYNCLHDVVAAKLLIRDVNANQKFVAAQDVFNFNSLETDSSLLITNLTPYHIYEITTKLIDQSGIESMSSFSTFFEYIPFSGQAVDVSISGVNRTILNGAGDVSFNISSNLIESQVSLIERLLGQINGSYDTTFIKENDISSFDKLIAYNIVRYDIDSGSVEDLGIIDNNNFVDSVESRKRSASSLKLNRRYKYVITPLIRDPHTVVTDKIETKDVETNRKYSYSPRKHRHPLALIKGLILSKNFISDDSKDHMAYGSFGASYTVDVTFKNESIVQIDNLSARYIGQNKISLSWSISGDSSIIDHIIIMKEVDGCRTIIGKSHCIEKNQKFIHNLSNNDIGDTRYILVPIYANYASGTPIISENVLIHQVEG